MMFLWQEGVLLGGMDDLTVLARCERGMGLRGDGEIDQVVIVVDPDVQDGLQLHLASSALLDEFSYGGFIVRAVQVL